MNMPQLRLSLVERTSLEGGRHMAYQDTAVHRHHVCTEETEQNMQHCIYNYTIWPLFVDT